MDLERMAMAFVLTRSRFSLPYSSDRTTDLALEELVASLIIIIYTYIQE